MTTFRQDLLFGARMLLARPGFTLAAVLSLALGIGANTTIFSLINSSLLADLPYREPERLVAVWTSLVDRPAARNGSTGANYLAWKEQARSFDAFGANFGFTMNIGTAEDGAPAERIEGGKFTASMWDVLGVRPIRGRVFTPEEDRNGSPAPVAVLSYNFWQRRFAGDPQIVGKTMRLDGVETDIIGVMPQGFDFAATDTDLWSPAGFTPQQLTSAASFLTITARLRGGVTIEQAQAEMKSLAQGLAAQFPDRNKNVTVALQGLREAFYDDVQRPLLVLQGTVGFVLLIACANIAGLLLARAASRKTEIAVRSALGAGRWRVIRQLLTENVLLAIVGGVVGCAFAWAGLRALVAALPQGIIGLTDARIDLRVLVATGLLSIVTGVLFGLAPAIQTSNVDLATTLKESGRDGMSGGAAQRFRSALVAVQIGLALMLLIGAALMANSLLKVLNNPLGADPTNLLTFEFRFPQNELMRPVDKYRGVGLWEIFPVTGLTFDRVWERIQTIPGVRSAAAISRAPLSGGAMGMPFFIQGRPRPESGRGQGAAYFAITPRYFETMKIPILTGRDFSRSDTATAPLVMIINKTMAERFFEGQDPIGQSVTLDFVPNEQPRVIVGVVGDSRIGRFQRQLAPMMYVPHLQQQNRWQGPAWDYRAMMAFVMRTDGEPMSLTPSVRRAVADIDRSKPAGNIRTVEQYLGQQARGLELYATLLAIFGAAAGLLASLGIYGVMAYTVAQRTREIGIRMALGAGGSRVLRLVTVRAIILIAIGLVIGLGGAIGLTRVLASELYEVSPTDPLTFTVVTIALTVVAFVACLIPTRRAMSVDPTVALRYE
ncbi:MAG TPA: ABC transporter permease [Vicinamibacterales bacterium]|nr:ABC transporter permease [Vicinamibacterales bacterium]